MSSKSFYRPAKRIVVTGGPGAGKTAVLELARRDLCRHVDVLPEAASVVFSGGFPRRTGESARRSVQRVIYRVQAELEALSLADDELVLSVCDRGTLDALAYWPGHRDDFFAELGTTMYGELARYHAVIHLRVPEDASSYRSSDIRRETHREAREIDLRLLEVWSQHPRRIVIDGSEDFMVKAKSALSAIRAEIDDHVCDPR
ncbi:MAG TPA: ATP-binding protein [Labilithrix sp.]|jgi:predicted ATPase|nr:ATP-binding protein [Labilithrix sp.]